MGLWGGGADPMRVDTSALAALMVPAVSAWFDAHIQVRDPNSLEAEPYDAITDTGGDAVPALLWDSGPQGALIQPVRQQSLGDFGSQAVGLVSVTIQAAVPDDVPLRNGLQIKVLDGGGDVELSRHLFQVASGIDSSLRWVKRIHAFVVT